MMSLKSYLLIQASIVAMVLCMTPSSNARQTMKVSSDIVNTTCSKTRLPSFCLELLKSTPGTATADLKGLGKITLTLAHSNATKTLDQLQLLILKTSDPKLKTTYESCAKYYDDAIGNLENSQMYFNHAQYYAMNVQASAAMTNAGDCDNETINVAADPSLKKGNQDLDQILSIVLAVSNLLHFSVYPTN